MKRNLSTQFVLMFGLMVMLLWLTGSGCKGSISNPPTAGTSPTTDTTTNTSPTTTSPTSTSPTSTLSAQINVSSLQIAMGDVVLNTISEQTVTIRNTGSAGLTVGQIAQADPLPLPFIIVSDNCSGKTVQPSASCSFRVQFKPTTQTSFSDSFDIPSNASNEASAIVNVTGNGKALRAMIAQINPNCSTGEIEIIVSVANHVPVPGLTTTNFHLNENGALQFITSVSAVVSPLPASVGMALDYTTSMAAEIPNVVQYSQDFVDLMNAGDEAAVIKFAEMPQLMSDFTGTIADLKTAISTTPTSIGRNDETRLYDALWFSVDTTSKRRNNKAVVALTDGVDVKYNGQKPASATTLDDVIAHAFGTGVAIYPIGLGTVDENVLNSLANGTAGQYFHINSSSELGGVYHAIRDILSGQYSIKYFSSLSLHGSVPITLSISVVSGTDEGSVTGQFAGCP